MESRNVFQLLPYWIYADFVKLALNLEKQLKKACGNSHWLLTEDGHFNKGSVSTAKQILRGRIMNSKFSKQEVGWGSTQPIASSHKFFTCRGVGHIDLDCPNHRIMAFIEKENDNLIEKLSIIVVPMYACHLLLGKLWQYDRRAIHNGF